jgi:predicted dehydrogenase
MAQLRVGLIGCGRISDLHALGYENLPAVCLVAVYDNDRGIDLVKIVVPPHLHAQMAIAVARAGQHGSVQKPMALNATRL